MKIYIFRLISINRTVTPNRLNKISTKLLMDFNHNLKDILLVFRMFNMVKHLWYKVIKEWDNLGMELILKETQDIIINLVMEWDMLLNHFLKLTQDTAHQVPLFLPNKLEAMEEVYQHLIFHRQISPVTVHQLKKMHSMISMTCLESAVKFLSLYNIFFVVD